MLPASNVHQKTERKAANNTWWGCWGSKQRWGGLEPCCLQSGVCCDGWLEPTASPGVPACWLPTSAQHGICLSWNTFRLDIGGTKNELYRGRVPSLFYCNRGCFNTGLLRLQSGQLKRFMKCVAQQRCCSIAPNFWREEILFCTVSVHNRDRQGHSIPMGISACRKIPFFLLLFTK